MKGFSSRNLTYMRASAAAWPGEQTLQPLRRQRMTGKFKPEYSGQLGFYVALVDDRLRRAQHADTVGLLLVADKNDAVVRYSLAGQQNPFGVASYDLMPPAVRAALPAEADLASALRPQPDEDPGDEKGHGDRVAAQHG